MLHSKRGFTVATFVLASLTLPAAAVNVAVVRVGDGTAAISAASSATFVDVFNTSGTFQGYVALPSSGSNAVTLSNSPLEGMLVTSGDGNTLDFAGYNTPSGTAAVAGTAANTAPRVIGTINNTSAAFSLAATFGTGGTSTNSYNGQNIRSGVTDNGTNFFGAGSDRGTVRAAATNVLIQNSVPNTRVISIFSINSTNTLFFSTGSGTHGIYSFATALPTTASAASVVIDTGTSSDPVEFVFNSAGDVAYIADERTNGSGGVQKYTKVNSTWTLQYTFAPTTTTGTRGLAVDFSTANPTLYATSTDSKLYQFVDSGSASSGSVLSTAATNTAYRGVELTGIDAAALPEPTMLSILSIAGAGLVRRRRSTQ